MSSLKVLGALVLWRGMFLFLPLNWGRIAGRPEWPWMYGPLLTIQVLVCSQLPPVLPLGGCMSMWVVAHFVVAVYCFSLCIAVFFSALHFQDGSQCFEGKYGLHIQVLSGPWRILHWTYSFASGTHPPMQLTS